MAEKASPKTTTYYLQHSNKFIEINGKIIKELGED
jgi:hypothetical protein